MDQASLNLMIGQSVRVERGGPEARIGKLLAVKKDHVVVYHEEEGVLYYKNDHIKSLSLDAREHPELEENPDQPQSVLLKYIDEEDLVSVMANMKYRWVQINRGGPEKIEGVLVDANDQEVTLVVGNEVVRVVTFHIRNISYGITRPKEQEDENSAEKGNKEKNNHAEKDKPKEKENSKEKDNPKEKDYLKDRDIQKAKGDHKVKGKHSQE